MTKKKKPEPFLDFLMKQKDGYKLPARLNYSVSVDKGSGAVLLNYTISPKGRAGVTGKIDMSMTIATIETSEPALKLNTEG